MMSYFRTCYQRVGDHEGGWSDHPRDPGGPTMKGVTQKTYDSWRRRNGFPPRPVREIKPYEHEMIYREFWYSIRADELPPGVAYVAFDSAILFGPDDPAKWMQMVSGAKVDGKVGPETVRKVRAIPPDKMIRAMCDMRKQRHEQSKNFPQFGKGWLRRLGEVEDMALGDAATEVLRGDYPPSPLPPPPAPPAPPAPPSPPPPDKPGLFDWLWRLLGWHE